MKLNFWKYEGAGNDFILLDNRTGTIQLNQAQITFLCDRHFGIGADGLMLLEPDHDTDFKMVYYNSDGAESSMCGNGGRCITAFAKRLGVVSEKAVFNAIDGVHHAFFENDLVALEMIDVQDIKTELNTAVLDTGSPHWVRFTEEAVSDIDLIESAHVVRYNDTYNAEGINVNFANITSEGISMRTYERGVEDETLACGTGATATALAAHKLGLMDSNSVPIEVPGGALEIRFNANDIGYSDILLVGPATFVFKGEITL